MKRFVVGLLLVGCEATMPPAPRAVPEPAPSGKAQLDDADIDRALAPLGEALAACVDWYGPQTRPEAILDIDPSGRLANVSVHRIINLSEKRCIERDLRMARFPAFTGPAIRTVRAIAGTPPPVDGGTNG